MKVVVGGARDNKGFTELGDQAQESVPDYHGEVSMQEFTSISVLKSSSFGKFLLYRPKSTSIAKKIAKLMETACNNPNIGYSTDPIAKSQIYVYGANSKVPISCDCASLTGFCISQATGDRSISNNDSSISDNMSKSGLFYDPVSVSALDDSNNPPYTGDVIVSTQSNDNMSVIVSGETPEGATSVQPSESSASTKTSWASSKSSSSSSSSSSTGGLATGFSARLKEPKPTEAAYRTYYKTNYCDNLNASYAWNRFSEILAGEACKLSRGPGQRWYLAKEDGYDRGQSPNYGAVMCFTNKKGKGGMIGIVETISDSSVTLSMVHPTTNKFRTFKVEKKNGLWSVDLDKDGYAEHAFQGFIYNPKIKTGVTTKSKLKSFIETAKNQVGDTGKFVSSTLNYKTSNPWSAAFIVAVAKKVGGLLDKMIPNTYSCAAIGSIGVEQKMGKWYKGPMSGGTPFPHAGDIVLFCYSSSTKGSLYNADKAGIIVYVESSAKGVGESVLFTYVVGDSSGRVEQKSARIGNPCISGLFRPYWNKIDVLSDGVIRDVEMVSNPYYDTAIRDAVLKDYKYVSTSSGDSQPSITSGETGLMLCAINYEAIQSSVSNLFQDMVMSDIVTGYGMITAAAASEFSIVDPATAVNKGEGRTGSIDMGHGYGMCTLDNTTLTIFYSLRDFFQGNGAGAIGFMANMWRESRFRTDAYNSGGGDSGLCQWYPGAGAGYRAENMRTFCDAHGGNWKTNLNGQLEFIAHELTTIAYFADTYNACAACDRTLDGAKHACSVVLTNYEGGPMTYYQMTADFTQKLWILIYGNRTTLEGSVGKSDR